MERVPYLPSCYHNPRTLFERRDRLATCLPLPGYQPPAFCATAVRAPSVRALSRSIPRCASSHPALDALNAEGSAGANGVDADVAFHRSISQATGNPFFLKTIDFLLQYLNAAVRAGRANQDFIRAVREEHHAILRAIRKQDAVNARTAAETHMFNAARRIVTVESEAS
jgi:DNA-binding FadR family transcriptional regulator